MEKLKAFLRPPNREIFAWKKKSNEESNQKEQAVLSSNLLAASVETESPPTSRIEASLRTQDGSAIRVEHEVVKLERAGEKQAEKEQDNDRGSIAPLEADFAIDDLGGAVGEGRFNLPNKSVDPFGTLVQIVFARLEVQNRVEVSEVELLVNEIKGRGFKENSTLPLVPIFRSRVTEEISKLPHDKIVKVFKQLFLSVSHLKVSTCFSTLKDIRDIESWEVVVEPDNLEESLQTLKDPYARLPGDVDFIYDQLLSIIYEEAFKSISAILNEKLFIQPLERLDENSLSLFLSHLNHRSIQKWIDSTESGSNPLVQELNELAKIININVLHRLVKRYVKSKKHVDDMCTQCNWLERIGAQLEFMLAREDEILAKTSEELIDPGEIYATDSMQQIIEHLLLIKDSLDLNTICQALSDHNLLILETMSNSTVDSNSGETMPISRALQIEIQKEVSFRIREYKNSVGEYYKFTEIFEHKPGAIQIEARYLNYAHHLHLKCLPFIGISTCEYYISEFAKKQIQQIKEDILLKLQTSIERFTCFLLKLIEQNPQIPPALEYLGPIFVEFKLGEQFYQQIADGYKVAAAKAK